MKSTLLKTASLILFLLIQFNAIGQKDTSVIIKNDSVVITTKQTAIYITKDLLKKDILEEEVEFLKKDTSLLQKQIAVYKNDSLLHRRMEQGYLGAIGNYQKSLSNCEQYARKKEKELAKTKFKSTASQAFLLILSIFLITKL